MHNTADQTLFSQAALHLDPRDTVGIAKFDLEPGLLLAEPPGEEAALMVRQRIPAGHKVALVGHAPGEAVVRYGQVIGVASRDIQPGDHLHTHNVNPSHAARAESRSIGPESVGLTSEPRTFMGFERRDGRVGTRNFIGVIATAQCAAQVCRRIAGHFTPERLAGYPNVDGVIALTPAGGCGGRADYEILQRTLAGMARHPNIGAAVVVGLGCEGNQLAEMADRQDLVRLDVVGQNAMLVIQELGGSRKTIEAGVEVIEGLLPRVDRSRRSPQSLSKLILALECGGSDSWSGITANPLVGLVSDEVVRQGGTAVLAETPEIYGAEHLLVQRAARPEVGEALLTRLRWWKDYTNKMGASFEDNPAPGNQAGGLTNICEKSLGAIAKSGSTPLRAVYEYAETIREAGFVFMDTTGYDPVSVTGMVAGGCNLVLFTTGRGSVFGFKPAPVVKISSNTPTYNRMAEDMDFNAGRVLEGQENRDGLARELLDLVIAAASGQQTASEVLGLGEIEFSPWEPVGPV